MLNGATTLGWRAFQGSLARILQLTIVVITPQGGSLDVYHAPGAPLSEFGRYPALSGAYKQFFHGLSQLDRHTEEIRVLTDPLDLPVAIVPLDNTLFLALVGGLDKRNPGCRADFQARLKAYGVRETDRVWALIPVLTPDELKKKAANVQRLYTQLLRSRAKTTASGSHSALPVTLEAINTLLVDLLDSEHFDLYLVLDLVVCTLIILFQAEGAWVFTYHYDAQTTTVYRGGRKQFLLELKRGWEAAVSGRQDPVAAVERWSRIIADIAPELRLQTTSFQRNDWGALLGVINPEDEGNLAPALAAFAEQVAVAMEAAALCEYAQRRMGSLFNFIRHGIIIMNHDGKAMVANQAAKNVFAATGAALPLGQPLEEHGFSRSVKLAACRVAATGESYFRQQVTIGHGDAELHLIWDIAPLRRDDGVIVGAVLILEDVTETVHLHRRMQEWEKLATAGQVAVGLTHEIRNPLAAAVGAIQLFDLVHDETKRQEILAKLRIELTRMNKILTSFLRFAKPGAKKNLQSIDFTQVIEDLRFLLQSEANLHDVDLIIQEAPQNFPKVRVDTDNLKQVFINIAKNAIEAMTENGRLEISMDWDAERVWVSFKDNGPGIPKENLQRVLQPFFTTKPGGTGLGLWISSTIIQQMGGELRMESELGRGTTVHIILPIKPDLDQDGVFKDNAQTDEQILIAKGGRCK
jgi:signal transduction histidine kinase